MTRPTHCPGSDINVGPVPSRQRFIAQEGRNGDSGASFRGDALVQRGVLAVKGSVPVSSARMQTQETCGERCARYCVGPMPEEGTCVRGFFA